MFFDAVLYVAFLSGNASSAPRSAFRAVYFLLCVPLLNKSACGYVRYFMSAKKKIIAQQRLRWRKKGGIVTAHSLGLTIWQRCPQYAVCIIDALALV